MATKEQIKNTILAVAGNPVSGDIAELADVWAAAIFDLDNTKAEKRVVAPEEVR